MPKEPTYIDSLSSRIKTNLKKGYNKESLKWALVNQGHSRIEVDKAFRQAEVEISKESIEEAKRHAAIALQPTIEPILDEPSKKGFFARLFGL